MKYCGVATTSRSVRVYTRCPMGMPGSETALEELMCRVLGDFLQTAVTSFFPFLAEEEKESFSALTRNAVIRAYNNN